MNEPKVREFLDCPWCKARAFRVRRRVVDRWFAWMLLRFRYQCTSAGCGWEGNIRHRHCVHPAADSVTATEKPRGSRIDWPV